MINIVCPSRYKITKKVLRDAAREYLKSKNSPQNATVNIIFVGARKMKSIASTYKGENVALPVLAFPYDDNPSSDEHLIGEVIMCYPQVVLLAAERGKMVEDMIIQLLQHGLRNIVG